MKSALIFAGTTEGRVLAERLIKEGIPVEACVATQYGEETLKGVEGIRIHTGRLSEAEMRDLYERGEYFAVVDCTHPFATEVSENIRKSLSEKEPDKLIPYIRVAREWENQAEAGQETLDHENVTYFADAGECARFLEGNKEYERILLTTGSKELPLFCNREELRERLVVRVLPGRESMECCWKMGLTGKQILAMQGASTKEMNLAVIGQYGIDCLVTKESGKVGGEGAKLEAAREAGIAALVIKRPIYGEEFGECSMEEAFRKVCILAQNAKENPEETHSFRVVLAGIGMGDEDSMTIALKRSLENSDYVFGASRLLNGITCRGEKYPYYLAGDILGKLRELRQEGALNCGDRNVTILFSGDSGFYSGCKKVRDALSDLKDVRITVLPGISSLSAFSAKIGEEWQDAQIISAHGVEEGKWISELFLARKRGRKIFLLTSGPEDVRKLGACLLEEGFDRDEIKIGFQLSYENEKVFTTSPQECGRVMEKGLYVVMVVPCAEGEQGGERKKLVPCLKDDAFCRDKVPMTKEEIRALSICKLGLWEGAVVYDVGAGTGSVSVQMAAMSPTIKVYAVEENEKAIDLIWQNKKKFGLDNLYVVKGTAPEALKDLPAASHAFIGGTRGKLREILDALYQKNGTMQVVINTVSLEGMAGVLGGTLEAYGVTEPEIVSVWVSKAHKAGDYHLMIAGNPVTIHSFQFQDAENAKTTEKQGE